MYSVILESGSIVFTTCADVDTVRVATNQEQQYTAGY